MGMFNLAMNLAPQVAARLDLSGRHRLLDLGGGPGTYAVHFCLKNPRLKATVFDLPSARPFALKTIGKFGLADRIDFQEGDYVSQNIEGLYDAAWLSQILHAEGPETCRDIIQKTASALKPGGLIIIHEFIMNDTMDGPLFPALFSLNMLLGTSGGQAYSEKQIRVMLADAGTENIQRIPLQSPNDSGIIQGILKKK
jgi:SAM-dependent methyltransferase